MGGLSLLCYSVSIWTCRRVRTFKNSQKQLSSMVDSAKWRSLLQSVAHAAPSQVDLNLVALESAGAWLTAPPSEYEDKAIYSLSAFPDCSFDLFETAGYAE
eukprot:6491886-Amphidinium_carterae.4